MSPAQEEVSHLRSQNEQLWKIIEKQRGMIQTLQKENARLSADRDTLTDKLDSLEKEWSQPTEESLVQSGPMPPPRSPYRPQRAEADEGSPKEPPIPTPSKSSSSVDRRFRETLPRHPLDTSSELVRPTTPCVKRESAIYSRSMPTYAQTVKNASSPNLTYHQEQPNALSDLHLRVVGSMIKPNEKGKEVVAFVIAIGTCHQDAFQEKWRIEKLYSDFLHLDAKLKQQQQKTRLGKLPDKALFSSHAPNKVDQRKLALEHYLQHILSLPFEDPSDLCDFLNTDLVEPHKPSLNRRKEGYLTKRGKNFGGWKTRYFVMKDNLLEYYESKEGAQLGSIRLTGAQIGKQQNDNLSQPDDPVFYRHAFLIVEQRKASSSASARHILCASSDEERDAWVQTLCYPKRKNIERQQQPPTPSLSSSSSDSLPSPRISLDQKRHRPPLTRRSSVCALVSEEEPRALSPPPEEEKKRSHRMTFWSKRLFSEPPVTRAEEAKTGLRHLLSRPQESEKPKEKRPPGLIFGVSLEQAVKVSKISPGYELPAIVYRCIEFLDAMNAVQEEGLYRLSGSNAALKHLQERFDQEGDVNLLKETHDIHVVAGLLKLWLRELPTSVLTRELRADFLLVIDLLDRKDRINELGRLVSLLPIANYTLLRALTAHLIRVVKHADTNKMTMRNVSIVFSPTLGIPATIFNFFMSEFEYIFWTAENGEAAPRKIEQDLQIPSAISRQKTLRLVREEQGRSNRNSVNYMDSAPNTIVNLEKNSPGSTVMVEDEEVDDLTF
ncbi:hypothetical protein BY458DRAFT_458948 [Sporodiniella umbellata]|nr:hypothetical protein BY458DRAFT_458948 [Sporodiniella umbellata]